jgi:mono/diheme cytochrome c family protein
MREQLARWLAVLNAAVMVLMALTFAWMQAVPPPDVEVLAPRPEAPPLEPQRVALVERGRTVYAEQGCAMCHSIAGAGNPRTPLDGVGVRRGAEELHDWIIGAEHLEEALPDRPFRLKQRYRALPSEDLEALVAYMQSLNEP